MPIHTVAQGDTMQTIAKAHGFRQWRTVFGHPKNSQLRQDRPNPEVLAPGDTVFVPDLEPKTEPARVDAETVFVLAPVRRQLVLSLQSADGTSLAGTPYTLSVEGTEHQGVVDSQGRVLHDIGIDARRASVMLDLGDEGPATIEVDIGGLDPVETDEGVRARLYNLGFVHAAEDTGLPGLSAAMVLFRESCGLPPQDDPLSPDAREALLFAHGC